MTDTALEIIEEKHAGGRPPEVTHNDAKDYLRAISEGMTQDQAADIVGFDRRTMEKWVKGHRELHAEVARARAKCIRSRIRAQQKIGDVSDIKGLNAAVKANACLLAAYDDRFRKARDGEGSGGGTNITVITAVQPQSVAGFFAAGGKAQPQMVKVLIEKYGKGILGEITEETALRIAAESVSENDQGTPAEASPIDNPPLDEGSTSDNTQYVTLTKDGVQVPDRSRKNKNGTQPEDRGGSGPSARAHTHPATRTPNPLTVKAPPDPIPVPGYVDPVVIPPESVILESRVRPEEAPDAS